jgi:acetylornithine deacetylase/succinyl-diaminopimelate desuccinylase-like protein
MAFSEQTDEAFLEELADYVAIASVSRDADAATMRQAAEWLVAHLGFADVAIMETGGHPVVTGSYFRDPSLPTILIYGHYDVQPTGDLNEWNSSPFTLTRQGDVALGRGISDDKGPVYIVLKALESIIENDGVLPLNVKFLFEGEEEIGSPSLPGFVAREAERLACDLVISADGAMWRASEPSLSLTSKGLISFDLVANGAEIDLHSGRYGGTVANPIHALVQVIDSMRAPDGAICVDGFYDGIKELSDTRRAELARVVFSDEEFLGPFGVREPHGEPGYTTLERLWERPTLEVNGISGGGKYTVIPHQAVAYLSCRLVRGQDPDAVVDAIERHVKAQVTPGVSISIEFDPPRLPAYGVDADHPSILAAKAALEVVYPGQEVLLAAIAGTLPASTLFEETLGVKTLFFSFSTSDERLHAPNEYLRIRRLREGMVAWSALMYELGRRPELRRNL